MAGVKAQKYGIDYEPIENLDLKVEEVKKYRFYKINKINAYFIEGENPNVFEKQSNYYDTDYSAWSKEKPNLKNNREIKERNVYIYQEIRKIKNFYIEILDDSENVLEFGVYFNGLTASKSASCLGCTNHYYMYISDENYDKAVNINGLNMNYEQSFSPQSLMIRVKFNKENIRYRILIYGNNLEADILYEGNFLSDLDLHEYTIADFEAQNAFGDEVIKYEEDSNMYLKDSFKEYSYKDRFYLYEFELKEYYPTYEENVEGFICDFNDFIVEKKYFYLETANIKDNIIINSENYDLSDYIKTNLPFETSSNIDISKNGNYKIKYIFKTKTIEKDVQVKTNREYVEALELGIKNKNTEIEEVINNKNEIIEHLENSIKTKDEIISKRDVERIVTKQSPIPIILITIGIMLIIICIIKSLKKMSN